MTLLDLVRTFCDRATLPAPNFVIGYQNAQIVQIVGLLNEVLEDLCDRWTWQDLVLESTFTTVAAEDQGAISTLAPTGFGSILNDTIYDRTLRLPIYGPISANNWQALKALPATGPFYKYRFRGNHLLINPIPSAGHTCAFEYKTLNCVNAADGSTKQLATLDTDTFAFPDKLLIAGLRWKWRAEKGLDYAELLRRYEELANNASGRDGTKGILSLSNGPHTPQPGVIIPSGNWNVT
jgi:hypothetical protein